MGFAVVRCRSCARDLWRGCTSSPSARQVAAQIATHELSMGHVVAVAMDGASFVDLAWDAVPAI